MQRYVENSQAHGFNCNCLRRGNEMKDYTTYIYLYGFLVTFLGIYFGEFKESRLVVIFGALFFAITWPISVPAKMVQWLFLGHLQRK